MKPKVAPVIAPKASFASWRTSFWLPAVVIALSLAILGGTISRVRDRLRSRIRDQIIARDGTVLHAVTLMPQYDSEGDEAALGSIQEPANQLTLLLRTSRLRGVLAARLFDASGNFLQSFPANVEEDTLLPEELENLHALHPSSTFYPSMPLSAMWVSADPASPVPNETAPVQKVSIPLHEPGGDHLLGVAQFLIDGRGMAEEFQRLDAYLGKQSALYFGVGGALLSLVIGLAFFQLREAARRLELQSRDLIQANRELLMTAKTSAVGAVTSHLIHELKNPLSGLHHFVSSCARDGGAAAAKEDWRDAVSATRRMQSTIQEIVTLLREEQTGTHYTLGLPEMAGLVVERLRGLAASKGVALRTELVGEKDLPGRVASLVMLILVNLGTNAIQASSPKGAVIFRFDGAVGGGEFRVCDSGEGFQRDDADGLFHPRASTHEGGTGIGLAICKQLANHLAASLELKETQGGGCTFVLRLSDADSAFVNGLTGLE